jgi:hypothetical protein
LSTAPGYDEKRRNSVFFECGLRDVHLRRGRRRGGRGDAAAAGRGGDR